MNLKQWLRVTVVASLWQTAAGQQQPIKLEIAVRGFPVTLQIDSRGATNLLVQYSQDLKAWQPSLHIFTKLSSLRVIDGSTFDGLVPPRFYRAVSDSLSVDQMIEAWKSNAFSKYSFRFERKCFCHPFDLSATVTVHDGKVISVSDTRSNGE